MAQQPAKECALAVSMGYLILNTVSKDVGHDHMHTKCVSASHINPIQDISIDMQVLKTVLDKN